MSSKDLKETERDERTLEHHTRDYEAALDPNAEFGGTEARKGLEERLLRKLDARMSILIVIYILNYIDRNNAAAARLRGFEEDLGLVGSQFATILSIFYVGYITMQVPSNMFLNHFGKPSVYLPACMALWGLLSTLTGAAHNFTGALVTRFFLGICECAFYPGAIFLLSKWYTRSELGLRTAILTCGSMLSSAFGSLIASGILDNMEGVLGHAAWRWLFFIEGALTILVALVAVFVLPDFPSNSHRWLSPIEVRLAVKRMEEDAGTGDEGQTEAKGQGQVLIDTLTDRKVMYMALNIICMVISLSFNAFFPTLTATLGYNRTVTLLLCAPPWVFATLVAFAVTRHSDATGERSFHMIVPLCVGLVGFVIASCTMNTAARYFSLFLMAQSYTAFIIFLAWISSTFPRPPSKRAVVIAFINAFGQLGNIAGSYIWPTAWGESYRYSYAICIATNGMAMVMILAFRAHLKALNEKAEKDELDKGVPKGYRYLL
ncbi:MFS general substrate transporter [Thelephora terrestris]|uniref:MFS general substrate transporter n=1 Tax=Thelephora terrestris TaxID=56493 RepID=A0A9P6H971_9AGAM|nr:MFS general substrate transporter [Thelephora terrestris]